MLMMRALKALLATEWESAASLATWTLAALKTAPGVDNGCQVAWIAHTIIGR